MKNYIFQSLIFISFLSFFYSCFETSTNKSETSDITGTKNCSFAAILESNQWNAQNAYYSIDSNRIEISAVSKNYEMIIIRILVSPSKIAGDYPLADTAGQVSFISESGNFTSVSGNVTINSFENNLIAGTFNFIAKNSTDTTNFITLSDGTFGDVPYDGYTISDNFNISATKQMKVNVISGEIQQEEGSYEIIYSENLLNIQNNDFPDKSFTIKIKNIEKNGTNITLYPDDELVQTITIDGINKNQTTIWYKNDNTLTFF
jgi:hypothetical protein